MTAVILNPGEWVDFSKKEIKVKDSEIKRKVESEAKDWGIKIHLVTITDLAITRSIRLIQNQ